MYSISKSHEFDAGHRLSKGYVGKCANFHGHRYRVDLELESSELDDFDMVFDFGSLKLFWDWVDQTFDHKTILYQGDSAYPAFLDILENLGDANGAGLVLVSDNPTAEVLAKLFLEKAKEQGFGEFVSSVTVWETPTSYAMVYND